ESLGRYSQVYFPIIDLIRPPLVEYMKFVKAKKIKDVDTEVINHITGKLMIYYLNDKIELEDELITGLFELSDEWTPEVIEFIGRSLKSLTKPQDKEIYTRAMALWDYRKPKSSEKENSFFGLWFICDEMDYEWRVTNFIDSLKVSKSTEMLWQVF